MPIEAICPNASCAKQYTVPDNANGRSVRCKACGETFVINATNDWQQSPSQTKASHRPPVVPIEITGIGRFQIRKKLGSGAFGTVYRAYDPQLDREVALKVPNPGTLDSPQRVERFLREAKAAAKLRHPHIVPVFDAGKDGDHYYIASAFINGKPLADSIEEKGTDFRRATRLARELAEALAYAHEEGIVHRDVKSTNAMVDANDRLHLMDFGLAARAEDGGEAKLTKDGSVMGTPAYMSPEQAKGQKGEAKPATDQYAVGVVLYELLTGEVPFRGPVAIVIHNVIHTDPKKPSELRKDVPRDLETICLKAMSKRPKDRYAGCQELADDLRRWLEGEPITARRLSTAERVTRWVRKNPVIAGSISFAFLALLLGMTVALWQMSVAQTEEGKARAAKEEETRQRGIAVQRLDDLKVETAKKEEALLQSLAQARMATHRFNIATARDLALKGDYAKARETLGSCPFDMRGWEWHYLASTVQQWAKEKPEQPKFEPRIATVGDLKGAIVLAFKYAPDAKQFVGFCSDKRLRVWDAASGEEKDSFELKVPGANLPIASSPSMGVSPDGRFVALPVYSIQNNPNQVALWDARDRKLVRVHQVVAEADLVKSSVGGAIVFPEPTVLEFSPNGRWLACAKSANLSKGEQGGRVAIWDVATGQEQHSLVLDQGDAVCLAFSPDGKRLAGGTSNKMKARVLGGGYATAKVHVWDLDAKLTASVTFPLTEGATSIQFSPNGQLIACGDYLDRVVVADATTGESRFVGFGASSGVAFTPDSSRLIGANVGSPTPVAMPGQERRITLKAWDVVTGQELLSVAAVCKLECDPEQLPKNSHYNTLPRLAVIPGQTGSGIALQDGASIRVFDAPFASEPFSLERGVNLAASINVNPQEKGLQPLQVVALALGNKWLTLATSGEITGSGPDTKPWNGLNPPKSLFWESTSVKSVIHVWSTTDGRLVTAFNGPRDPVVRTAVSPGGEWVAVLIRRVPDPQGPPPRPGVRPGMPPGTQPAPKGTIRMEVSLWDVKKQAVVRTWKDLLLKQPMVLGFRGDGSHLSLVGNDESITWRVSDGEKVDGVNFEASESDVRKIWKSNAGDLFVLPNPKQLPGSAMGVGINSDGRLLARVQVGGVVTLEETR